MAVKKLAIGVLLGALAGAGVLSTLADHPRPVIATEEDIPARNPPPSMGAFAPVSPETPSWTTTTAVTTPYPACTAYATTAASGTTCLTTYQPSSTMVYVTR